MVALADAHLERIDARFAQVDRRFAQVCGLATKIDRLTPARHSRRR
jgi:hypothetical protein